MEIFNEPGARIMYSPNIPYLRADLMGLLQDPEYRAALENPKLWELVTSKTIKAIALNHCQLMKYSTDYFFYKRDTWVESAGAKGVKKIASIIPENVWMMMSSNFTPIVKGGAEMRFFPQSQFYETSESVAWF